MEVNIMYSKKALPVGTMFLVLVIALAVLGVGYALWSETLSISGTVTTGEVDVEFSQGPVKECVDINGVLTCPEPPEKADVANCTVEWLGPDGDSEGDDGSDQLLVTVTGMYPSYHCKVSFDVTSTGNVPVHVWLPEPTDDNPEWVATDFETCYEDGVQLHQNDSTGDCTIDIHFNNDQAPPEGSSHTFGWTILATQYNEDPVAPGAVVLLEGSYEVVSSPVEIENLAGLDYEILDNGDGTVTFNLWPTLFDGSPVLKALTVGIVNEAGTFSQDLTYGSSDGTPPDDELVSGDGGVTYSYTAPAGSLTSGEVGVFLMVNGRAPDDGNDLQRWIGITPMAYSNDWSFDWSWANRFKITLP
jgi:hypothetical protein